jgi:hypothetical protein
MEIGLDGEFTKISFTEKLIVVSMEIDIRHHQSHNFELWIAGLLLVELFYTIRFVKKETTSALDLLKHL